MTDNTGESADARPCTGCGTLLGLHAVFQLSVEHPDVHTPGRCEQLAGMRATPMDELRPMADGRQVWG